MLAGQTAFSHHVLLWARSGFFSAVPLKSLTKESRERSLRKSRWGTLLKFCDLRREGTASGCVLFRNLLHDSSNDRIKPKALRKFSALLASEQLSTSTRGSGIVGQSIDANYSELALQGYAVRPLSGRLAKVVNGQDLLNYNMKKKDGTKFASRRGRPGNPEKIIRSVLNKPTYQRDNIDANSSLQGSRPINWVTKLVDLNRVISEGPERLRAILGLTHYNEDQILCVVEYPQDHTVSLKNPTALDAGCNYIYWSTGTRGRWGRTVDLEGLGDGLPEAVHGPVQLNSSFRFKYIGQLTRTAPAINLKAFKSAANKETIRICGPICKVIKK